MSRNPFIHPSAVVEPRAQLGAGARVGPFCYVGPQVVLGDDVELLAHVTVTGATTLGSGTKVWPQAVLGGPPQDLKHKDGPSRLVVGNNCLIREGVTMNTGTDYGHQETVVGDDCFFLAYSHVAHDCIVGNNVTMTNNSVLGGHCEIGDHAIIGGMSAIHQFTRIGQRAFIGGMTGVTGDVIPFGMVTGDRGNLRGFNIVGLKRAGVSRSDLATLRAAYKLIFGPGSVVGNAHAARDRFADVPAVVEIIDFLTTRGKRHFTVPEAGSANGAASGDEQG